ncbi:peptidoglycan editing factor PgeF [Granulicoccus phenolivorans]|uniref:peptidoglycan editing factor PgeF n=1 Tax=Granulicoccus phenolivorans TaxID=266854 RepID=UPI0006842294|nr:peptidoglycan editing factor PgeF [Granulicoccus phenolivorans]
MFGFREALGPVGVAFTDRAGGVSADGFAALNLGRTDVDRPDHIRENFHRVQTAIGADRIIALAQVHGAEVHTVDEAFLQGWGPEDHLGPETTGVPLRVGDGLVTTAASVALCIRVADCLPVLFADPERGVIGAAHAGRVGLAAGVLPGTVEAMRQQGAEQIRAWIGPAICGECYEVPEQMRAEVAERLPATWATTSWGTPALDLAAGAEAQLAELGIEAARIGPCTRTSGAHFSHRNDPGAGRQAGLIWLASA